MIGLLYKDLLVQRKQIGYYLAFVVVYTALVAAGVFPSAILAGLVVLIGMMLPMSSFSYDDLARWDRYAAATPAGRRGIVNGKYLFALASLLVATVPIFLIQCILSLAGLSDMGIRDIALVVLGCAGVGALIDALELPFFIKFGAEKSRVISVVVFVVFFGGAMLLGQLEDRLGSLPAPPTWLLRALPGLLALVGIGVCVISYCISQAICQKKEF